jgi:hypothetical protein
LEYFTFLWTKYRWTKCTEIEHQISIKIDQICIKTISGKIENRVLSFFYSLQKFGPKACSQPRCALSGPWPSLHKGNPRPKKIRAKRVAQRQQQLTPCFGPAPSSGPVRSLAGPAQSRAPGTASHPGRNLGLGRESSIPPGLKAGMSDFVRPFQSDGAALIS